MNQVIRRFTLVAVMVGAACAKDQPKAKPEASARVRTLLATGDSNTAVPLIAGDTLHISGATREFYRRRRWRPAWIDGDKPTGQGEGILKALSQTETDGLNPVRYRYDLVRSMAASIGAHKLGDVAEAQYGADLDVLLTEAFTRYITDLSVGTLDPKSSGLTWTIRRSPMPKRNLLRALQRGATADAIVARVRPPVPQYARLTTVLARLEKVRAAGGWPQVPEGKAEKGDSSVIVSQLRARLSNSEDPREAAYAQRGAARPMVYDHDLFLALQHFQQRNAIDADGDLGAKTLQELNHPIDERIEEVKINLDRWRWIPHDMGKMYVLVNVAGFEMSVVENGHPIEEMNVVVGQQGWETPIFMDTLESMVVNPSWNVPPSIASKEMGNVSDEYLVSHHFVRTSDGGYRQLPGPDNALGQFKFQFPNKDNIYLHDTPADALFARTERAFSHGCIRLERPRDLAYLLGGKLANKTPEQIDALVATGDERTIPFRRQIPIYILYFTTWVDDDGTVRFHHDVYGHDEALQNQTHKFDQRST